MSLGAGGLEGEGLVMSENARPWAPWWIGVACVASIGACAAFGCGAEPPPPAHRTPGSAVPQSGLESALAGWCAEAGSIPGCDGGAL